MHVAAGFLRSPRAILFGDGQRHALGAVARALGQRALVCTDERLAGDAMFGAMIRDLQTCGLQVLVYDRTQAELPIAGVFECAEKARFKSVAGDRIIRRKVAWSDRPSPCPDQWLGLFHPEPIKRQHTNILHPCLCSEAGR